MVTTVLHEESAIRLFSTLGHDKNAVKGLRIFLFALKQTGVTAIVSGCLLNSHNPAAHAAHQHADLESARGLNQGPHADKVNTQKISSKKSSKVPEHHVPLTNSTSESSNKKEIEKNVESESYYPPLPEDAQWTQVIHNRKNKVKFTSKTADVGASSTSSSSKTNTSSTPTSLKKTVQLRPQTKPLPKKKKSSNTSTTSTPIIAVVPSSTISAATTDIDSPPTRTARYAGSNSMEITIVDPDSTVNANMTPEQPPVGISKEAQELHTILSELRIIISRTSLRGPLTEKERKQMQRGMKIAQALHLALPKEIQEQSVQLHLTKLLGPDDDELHTLLAMPDSIITLNIKPPELGPLIRASWLTSSTITDKKVFLSELLFSTTT